MKNNHLEKKFLIGGEVILTNKPLLVWTILGSCVTVTFFHKKTGLSAICHTQLPQKLERKKSCTGSCPNPCYKEADIENSMKYTSCAVKFMVEEFIKMGVDINEIEIGLYGGAKMLGISSPAKSIGDQNVEMARKILSDNGLQAKKNNTRGFTGRKVYFNTLTGKIEIEEIPNSTKSKCLV